MAMHPSYGFASWSCLAGTGAVRWRGRRATAGRHHRPRVSRRTAGRAPSPETRRRPERPARSRVL